MCFVKNTHKIVCVCCLFVCLKIASFQAGTVMSLHGQLNTVTGLCINFSHYAINLNTIHYSIDFFIAGISTNIIVSIVKKNFISNNGSK